MKLLFWGGGIKGLRTYVSTAKMDVDIVSVAGFGAILEAWEAPGRQLGSEPKLCKHHEVLK